MKRQSLFFLIALFSALNLVAQPADLIWKTQSKNSSESMPVGGGSVGMNVWVEDNDILFYVCRSGSFDENNTLLKLGRFRIRLNQGGKAQVGDFVHQRLCLNEGYCEVKFTDATITIWADVFTPIINIDITGSRNIAPEVSYETWRYRDLPIGKGESFQTSYKFGVPKGCVTRRDSIIPDRNSITFFHANADSTVFDATVWQQKLTAVKAEMYNPLGRLISGGRMICDGMTYVGTHDATYISTPYRAFTYRASQPRKHFSVQIAMHNEQTTVKTWLKNLKPQTSNLNSQTSNLKLQTSNLKLSRRWWREFWQRSYIEGEGECAEYTRNYTLFRYMMGCNAKGDWPTKFNGGLFTFDPIKVESGKTQYDFTPDFRRWGGGTHTAQNQRLLYWPLLKSGDFDLLPQQLDFYLRILRNAELRSETYWHHKGACFTEQLENFGLPEYDEYGKKRPENFDPGLQYNAWLEYTWDTVFEFISMAFEANIYCGMNINRYIPLAKSSLDFFNLHYRQLAKQRGAKETDADGHLIIYPGSAAETFKMAYNPASTIAALRKVSQQLIDYMKLNRADTAEISHYQKLHDAIPPLPFASIDGQTTLTPAAVWARVNNIEPMHMYSVYPWRIFGIGRDSLDIAIRTWQKDPFVTTHKGIESWEQAAIFAACMGLTDDAAHFTRLKMQNGPHRFTAFWGPGHDWTPDHNWGGSGMIGMQEMLVQEVNDSILLFPAWPSTWNVRFRLHLSHNTIVEAELRNGELRNLNVTPKSREKDVINMLNHDK